MSVVLLNQSFGMIVVFNGGIPRVQVAVTWVAESMTIVSATTAPYDAFPLYPVVKKLVPVNMI